MEPKLLLLLRLSRLQCRCIYIYIHTPAQATAGVWSLLESVPSSAVSMEPCRRGHPTLCRAGCYGPIGLATVHWTTFLELLSGSRGCSCTSDQPPSTPCSQVVRPVRRTCKRISQLVCAVSAALVVIAASACRSFGDAILNMRYSYCES